jgi:DNA mismatch endonuclease (patch repair protein)
MVDVLDKAARSALMAKVRQKNTAPELVVRRALHALGYRYRLNVKELPGSPDLVFPVRRKALFVHGCYWHAHDCRQGLRRPTSNVAFWEEKARANRERDQRKERALREAGWDVETVWECETKDRFNPWLPRIRAFLGDRPETPTARKPSALGGAREST